MSDNELTDLDVCGGIAKKKLGADLLSMENHPYDGICAIYKECGLRLRIAFNPITDDALNLQLRDEFEVEVNYFHGRVIIYDHDTGQTWRVTFSDKSEINRAVCLCILESLK